MTYHESYQIKFRYLSTNKLYVHTLQYYHSRMNMVFIFYLLYNSMKRFSLDFCTRHGI